MKKSPPWPYPPYCPTGSFRRQASGPRERYRHQSGWTRLHPQRYCEPYDPPYARLYHYLCRHAGHGQDEPHGNTSRSPWPYATPGKPLLRGLGRARMDQLQGLYRFLQSLYGARGACKLPLTRPLSNSMPSNSSKTSPHPYIMLLDEANLSSLEHYWSPFLLACDKFRNRPTALSLGGGHAFRPLPGCALSDGQL